MSSRPTLYLGKVTVSDGKFNFNDSIVTVSTNPASNDNLATKLYVDDTVNVQKLRIDAILGAPGETIDLSAIVSAIETEVKDRAAGEAAIHYKIDMLFKYFFRRSSINATIDADNQIIFNN